MQLTTIQISFTREIGFRKYLSKLLKEYTERLILLIIVYRSDVDFGVYQMAAIIDRSDINGSQFKALVSFGDHCLHHLFPTLDHGILPQLYPVFLQTCAEFQLEYREQSWWPALVGQYRQLARIKPKVYVPSKKPK